MENNNQVKNNGKGKNIVIVFLILIVLGLSGFIVYDKYVKEEVNTNETKNTTVTEKEESNEVKEVETTKTGVIYSGEIIKEDKDFGTINLFGKEETVKYVSNEQKLYISNKSIDLTNSGLNNIVVMGNYLVLGLDGSGYRFEIYNSSLEKVDQVGNSLGLLIGTKTNTDKLVIDDNNIIYYECKTDNSSSNLETYNLKIKDNNIEKVLISVNQNVDCTAQR